MTDMIEATVATKEITTIVPEVTLIAETPMQLEAAQPQLVEWVNFRLKECNIEVTDLTENLATAKKNHWNTAALGRALAKAVKSKNYYVKVLEALKAGYYLVPNFPGDVIAIRTTRKKPVPNDLVTTSRFNTPNSRQNTSASPLGEGAWVGENAVQEETQKVLPPKEGFPNNANIEYHRYNSEFTSVDFPFLLAKPQILKATERAMLFKCFDEITVLPGQNRHYGDPMIFGTIKMDCGKYGTSTKSLTFLITWFIELKDI